MLIALPLDRGLLIASGPDQLLLRILDFVFIQRLLRIQQSLPIMYCFFFTGLGGRDLCLELLDPGLHVRQSRLRLLHFQRQVAVLGILVGLMFGGLAQRIREGQVHFVVRNSHRFPGEPLLFGGDCQRSQSTGSRERAFVD